MLPQAQDFFNLNNFVDGDEEAPTKIWSDFYQPRFPVVIVQLLGWVRRDSNGNETITPITRNNLTISRANNLFGDNREIYQLAIRITYPNTFSACGVTFNQPVADLVYSIEFDSIFSDFAKGRLSFSLLFSEDENVLTDTLLPRQAIQNIRLTIGERNTPRPEKRLQGFWEISFVPDRDDVNILYTDANGLYLLDDDTVITNSLVSSPNNNPSTLFVPVGEEGEDFYCNITSAGVRQPMDVIRIKKE